MYSKISKKIHPVFKEYRILKLFFFLLTLYLLIEEFVTFLIRKPTLTSLSQETLKPSHFPDILICPAPSFELTSLQQLGYEHSYDYTLGYSTWYKSDGWIGNTSGPGKLTADTADTADTSLVRHQGKFLPS